MLDKLKSKPSQLSGGVLGAFFIVFAVLIVVYALVFTAYSYKLKRSPPNSVMAE